MRGELEPILTRVAEFPGETSFYYENLTTGETAEYEGMRPVIAASVIKLPVMIELFCQLADGRVSRDERIPVRASDRVPICGVLTLLDSVTELSPLDLCRLMITISDNMATNLLIDRLGLVNIHATLVKLGCTATQLNRKLFESRPEHREKRNTVAAREIGRLLAAIYREELVSPEASREMLDILLDQQLNHKLPFLLPDVEIAHKTGEDDGITHDVGVVFADDPYVVCILSQGVDTPECNRMIAEVNYELFRMHDRGGAYAGLDLP